MTPPLVRGEAFSEAPWALRGDLSFALLPLPHPDLPMKAAAAAAARFSLARTRTLRKVCPIQYAYSSAEMPRVCRSASCSSKRSTFDSTTSATYLPRGTVGVSREECACQVGHGRLVGDVESVLVNETMRATLEALELE